MTNQYKITHKVNGKEYDDAGFLSFIIEKGHQFGNDVDYEGDSIHVADSISPDDMYDFISGYDRHITLANGNKQDTLCNKDNKFQLAGQLTAFFYTKEYNVLPWPYITHRINGKDLRDREFALFILDHINKFRGNNESIMAFLDEDVKMMFIDGYNHQMSLVMNGEYQFRIFDDLVADSAFRAGQLTAHYYMLELQGF